MIAILNANMANAIRSRTVQKGIDPRDFTLVAFGGAGPLHGAEVAAELGIREVLVPPHPGITSAMGLITADLKYDAIRTEFQSSTEYDIARLNRDFETMEAEIAARFAADGVGRGSVSFRRAGDLRYLGQGYELRVACPATALDEAGIAAVFEAFHAQHKAEYGHVFRDSPIEIVNIRVTGIAAGPKLGRPVVTPGGSLDRARAKTGRCLFRLAGRLEAFDTPFYRRGLLPLDTVIPGPAIVLQEDSTTVVPPRCSLVAEASGNLIIRIGGAS